MKKLYFFLTFGMAMFCGHIHASQETPSLSQRLIENGNNSIEAGNLNVFFATHTMERPVKATLYGTLGIIQILTGSGQYVAGQTIKMTTSVSSSDDHGSE